jgi:hypothetical protein
MQNGEPQVDSLSRNIRKLSDPRDLHRTIARWTGKVALVAPPVVQSLTRMGLILEVHRLEPPGRDRLLRRRRRSLALPRLFKSGRGSSAGRVRVHS